MLILVIRCLEGWVEFRDLLVVVVGLDHMVDRMVGLARRRWMRSLGGAPCGDRRCCMA